MDQKLTGQFIAKIRKEKGFTQKQLAELLLISDKTVSKWETGGGLPEVSLMLPLCKELGVTVNELLSGKRLNTSEYKSNAEENIINLMKEGKHNEEVSRDPGSSHYAAGRRLLRPRRRRVRRRHHQDRRI